MLLGIALVGSALLVAVVTLVRGRTTETVAVPKGADRPTAVSSGLNLQQADQLNGIVDRVIVPMFSSAGERLGKALPPERIKKLQRRVQLAGMQGTWTLPRLLAVKAATLSGGAAAGVLAFLALRSVLGMVLAGALLFIGWFALDYLLDTKARTRQLEIEHALPDMLDQITICAEAGLGLDAAIARAARSNDNPLADEFGRTLQDVRLGLPRGKALEAMMNRTEVASLRLFVRSLIQADKSGVAIAQVLRVQAEEVREKRRQAAEERAMKLPVLLIVPLVLCILPSLFIVIMGPAAIRLMETGSV